MTKPEPSIEIRKKFTKAIDENDIKTVTELLDSGVSANCKMKGFCMSDYSALYFAAFLDATDIACLLLERGADVNGRPRDTYDTCLEWAAYHKNARLVSAFLAHGAEIDNGTLKLVKKKKYADMGKLVNDAIAERARIKAAAAALERANKVTFESTLNGRILEETYDFAKLERISVICNDKREPKALTRELFSEVDHSQLRKAFDEHVRRGGKVDEDDVFLNARVIVTKPALK